MILVFYCAMRLKALLDASLSASALESALMSNIAGMRTTPAASRL